MKTFLSFFIKILLATLFLSLTNLLHAQNNVIKFNTNDSFAQIKTAYPVYYTTANQQYGKLYFYNTLNGNEKGVYVYNMENGAIESFLNIQNTIGDVVYNEYKSEVLIAVNKPDGVTIYRYSGENNQFLGAVPLQGGKHVKEMYVSPGNRLYVLTGMRNDVPKLSIYNAENYQLINSKTISEYIMPPQGEFINYRADFDYDKLNDDVYLVIAKNDHGKSPYFSSDNDCLTSVYLKSLLIRINSDTITTVKNNLNGARKVVCTYPYDNNGNQYTQLFINGKKLYLYNSENNILTEIADNYTGLAYDEQNNIVYGYYDNNPTQNEGRKIIINSIDMNGNKQQVIDKKGQASAFFFNQYDNKLYFERKLDDRKLGETPLELYQVDVQSSPVQITDSVSLINNGFYVEYDNYNWYGFYYSNLATPYIDPYQNKIYLPNGGHSNVSVVDYTADEALMLKPYDENTQESFTWLSFPRLHSSSPSVQSVIGGDNIVPNNSQVYYKRESKLENLPLNAPTNQSFKYNTYNGSVWDPNGLLYSVQSELGYKLSLKYNTNPNQDIKLFMHGTVIDPATAIAELYADKENWIGYWLYQEQDIFDALGNSTDNINVIKHQDWSCVKTYDWFNPGTPGTIEPFWQCDHQITNIKYGDMVVLSGNEDVFNFQWNTYGNPPPMQEELSPEYYSYDEKADYTPIVVLLDSADNPLEIGVFENDTCIGANVVNLEDSMVVVRGYISGNASDSLSFEKYYGTKSTQKDRVASYYVKNRNNNLFEKRKISAAERSSFFVVSFRKPKNYNHQKDLIYFKVWPSPAFKNLLMEYTLPKKSQVTIELFNIEGKPVAVPVNTVKNKGINRTTWNLTGFSGKKLKTGLYLIKLTSGKRVAVKKILIQ